SPSAWLLSPPGGSTTPPRGYWCSAEACAVGCERGAASSRSAAPALHQPDLDRLSRDRPGGPVLLGGDRSAVAEDGQGPRVFLLQAELVALHAPTAAGAVAAPAHGVIAAGGAQPKLRDPSVGIGGDDRAAERPLDDRRGGGGGQHHKRRRGEDQG